MDGKVFSFEFFPPRTPEGKEKLRSTWHELAKLKPRFFSCTYGAGGSTREGTLETVLDIIKAGHAAAPHISCIAATRDDISTQLDRYKANGIRHIVLPRRWRDRDDGSELAFDRPAPRRSIFRFGSPFDLSNDDD